MLIELSQSALQAHFKTVCSVPMFLAHHCQLQNSLMLNNKEAEQLARLQSEKRRAEFILGRYALKDALTHIGKNTDTTLITWPDQSCSLSHSSGHAVAIACPAVAGIGIDIQLDKMPMLAMANRMLCKDMFEYWQQLPDIFKAKTLQRFWTIYEAIYKACPSPQPANFRHYRLLAPEAMQGLAIIDHTIYQFSIYSAELRHGFISIAIRD
jgi:4'-phosphopantetheinyl transferase EntD